MSAAGFKNVAVIGAGVMGSQIAAQVANAGVPVLLLDVVPSGATDRNALAKAALERLKTLQPAPLMTPDALRLMTPGNLEDDLGRLATADWIVEAVLEDVTIKRNLYAQIEAVRKPDSIVASNTSTIRLETLIEGLPERFAKDFLIAHFFNPPRYLRLLELVEGPATRPAALDRVRAFCDRDLGRCVVPCNDTPGFIANRLGAFFLNVALNAAITNNLTVEQADFLCAKVLGLPKTGVFGLLDLIGLDLMRLIDKSLLTHLPPDDLFRVLYRDPPLLQRMVDQGLVGRKGKGGFYRLARAADGSPPTKEALDLATGTYRPLQTPAWAALKETTSNLRVLCEAQDSESTFLRQTLIATLAYAASLVPDVTDSPADVDAAMELGYAWREGPFALMDRVGTSWLVDQIERAGGKVPRALRRAVGRTFYTVTNSKREVIGPEGDYVPLTRGPGTLLLTDLHLTSKPVVTSPVASVWDLGEGVLNFEMHTKVNIFTPAVFDQLRKTVDLIATSGGTWKGLVIHNAAALFSAGADLGFIRDAIREKRWDVIESFVRQGQATFTALRRAPFPSVAALGGIALGGGCEVALHCSTIQAHADTALGLVESHVGLIPCWGGCTQMLGRAFAEAARSSNASPPPVSHVFETMRLGKTTGSALEARAWGYLRATDGITMNKDRLLYDARAKVLALAPDYRPPEPWTLPLPGPGGCAALNLVLASLAHGETLSPHEKTIAETLETVLCGGSAPLGRALTESDIMDLECEGFLRLTRTPETLARIEHMLTTGKPLRN